MPKIIPIRELRDTNAISEMCHSSEEPVFITKNGYGDMVIMSLETFEKNSGMSDFYGDVKFSKGKYSDLKQKRASKIQMILRTADNLKVSGLWITIMKG